MKDPPLKVYAGKRWNPYRMALEYAIDMYPCGIFEETDKADEADIIVVEYPFMAATGRMEMDQPLPHAMKINTVRAPMHDITGMYLLFAHELGHAADLNHDQYGSAGNNWISIMAPNALDFMSRIMFTGKLLPILFPGDEEALRNLHCLKEYE